MCTGQEYLPVTAPHNQCRPEGGLWHGPRGAGEGAAEHTRPEGALLQQEGAVGEQSKGEGGDQGEETGRQA